MRTIHADLKTAQESAARTQYIYLEINSIDYSSKLIALEHIEEPYRDRATIILDNSDRTLDPSTVDLRGEEFSIGYGYVTGSGNRYCGDGDGTAGTPTLWVKSQLITSLEGESVCVLFCEGMWMMLRELQYLVLGELPYYRNSFGGTQTIKEILELILAEAGMTLNATFDDDGIIDTLMPFFEIDVKSLPSLASIIYGSPDMIQATKSYLRSEASKVFKLVYPRSTDPVDETYHSDKVPYFKNYEEKLNLVIPNDIIVYWGADPGSLSWEDEPYLSNLDSPGSAVDQASIDAYATNGFDGVVRRVYHAPNLTSESDADNRASAILTRFQAETLSGKLILPYHDCSVELYDRVSVEDRRGIS